MIDIKLIRENPELVRANFKKRVMDSKILDMFIEEDEKFRAVKKSVDDLRHRRNVVSEEINQLVKKGKTQEVQDKIQEAKSIPQRLAGLEDELKATENSLQKLTRGIPNILSEDVPYGKDGSENKVMRTVGEKPALNFRFKNHIELGKELDIIDTERAAKVSGARFYYLKNEAAMLDIALQKFAIDNLAKKGFSIMSPPLMLRKEAYEGVTNLDVFEEMLYKIQNEDLYLIATSEHSIAAYYMNELLKGEKLPLRFAGFSPCFRKEAGAHGKDTKGIFRVHNFNKVEQFVFCKPEEAEKEHELLLKNAEDMLKKLKIPYRVVELCSSQVGSVSSKTYDIELWMPAQDTYREGVSCSNCKDYQARGLNVKFIGESGNKDFVHTLNSTAIATTRTIVAILENYQQKDGSVKIPLALQDYLPFKKISRKH